MLSGYQKVEAPNMMQLHEYEEVVLLAWSFGVWMAAQVCTWQLRAFGHFGQSGSFIWVDPVAGRQAVFLGAEPFGRAHAAAWPALNDQILAL